MDLAKAAKEVLAPLGFEVLELQSTGSGAKRRLLLRIDRLDEQPVGVEDLTLATQVFGLELDRLDPFESAYSFEVESPGSERPLFSRRHFERFMGLEAKVSAQGETFKGRIEAVSDDAVTFRVGDRVGEALREVALGSLHARLAEWPSEPR